MSLHADTLAPDFETRHIRDIALSRNDFHIYKVDVQTGSRYTFSAEEGGAAATGDIVLRLWKNGEDVSGSNRKDESKIEDWTASTAGTAFLSVEGAVQSKNTIKNTRWTGIYKLSHSGIAKLAVDATANPVTCLPGGKTTISWTVTGGTGGVTVTVSGVTSNFNTRTGSTEVKCQRAEGRQTVRVSVVDSVGTDPPPRDDVYVAVHRPICALPSGGVSGQAATEGSTPDSATCKPPAPTLASSSTATSSSITASWSAAAGATLHKVQIGETPSSGTATYGSEQTPSGSGGTSHTFTGLTANKNYSIRVTAYNGTIAGGSDEASGFWTKPAAPANLRVSSRQPTSLTITWTAVSGLAYKVQRSGQTTWSTPSGTGTHKFTGLTAATAYTLKVRAENTAGPSTPASTSPTTPSVLTATLTPTSASCQTGNSIRLTWTATGGTAPYTATPASTPYTYRCSSTGAKTITFTIKDSGTPKQSITKQARITVTSPPAPPPPTPPDEPEPEPDPEPEPTCPSPRPPAPTGSRTITVRSEATTSWELRGTTAYEVRRHLQQDQTRVGAWQGPPACAYSEQWANSGAPYWTTVDTGQQSPRPSSHGRTERSRWTTMQTRWIRDGQSVPCREVEETFTRVIEAIYRITYTWNGISWQRERTELSRRNVSERDFSRTGRSRLCTGSGQATGSSESARGAKFGPGPHVLVWGERQIEFSVPNDASVAVSARTAESGGNLAVFTAPSGAEWVIDPSAATLSTALAYVADSADATLTAIARTLTVEQAEEPSFPEPVEITVVCAEIEGPSGDGVAAVVLEDEGCAVVDAATAAVTAGGKTISLTLPAGGEWLLAHLSPPDDAREAILAVDLGTGSWVSVDLETGAELERSVAEGSPAEMGGWLDAISKSEIDGE